MVRSIVAVGAVVLAASAAPAQVPASVASGVGSFGGGFRPPAPRFDGFARPGPAGGGFRMRQESQRPFGLVGYGGFYPIYPFAGTGGYYTGGFVSGGYAPYFVGPGPGVYADDPGYSAPLPAPTPIFESGQMAAKLTLEFPAAAEVWLDGKEVTGDAAAVRTVSSPAIRPGEAYTFHVRARWQADGRTYETTRDVPVGPGGRSRLIVVSGTAVK